MMSVLSIGVASLLVFLLPADAWAWGPITHIVHGSTVLEGLRQLSPALGSLLAANADRYLYGCVGADIIQAKAYTRSLATHCHRWPVAWRIVGSARSDGELAFAWGYMTHLAADILSHNHFVPLHLVLSFDGRTSGHAYWEARVDGLQDPEYADRLRRVLTECYEDCDALVNRVVEHTLFSFRTNKRIFDSLMGLTKLDRWQRLVRTVNDRSRFRLTRATVEAYNRACVTSATDLLVNRKQSYTQAQDPTGADTLARAFVLRRRLRRLQREDRLPAGLTRELADSLVPSIDSAGDSRAA
jgi:hypothetical protein